MGSFSIWHWLVVLLIVVLIFGTKKLKNIGTDLGGAVKGFKDGVRDGGTSNAAAPDIPPSPQQVAAGQRDAAERTIDVDARPAGSSGSGANNGKSSS